MITTLLFDIDNTLLDFHKCAWESMQRGFDAWGIAYDDKTYSIYQSVNDPLWRQIEAGTLTLDGLKQIRWAQIFAKMGIDKDGAAFEEVFRKHLHESCQPVTGAYEILEYLAPKYRIYTASNGPYNQQIHRLELADMAKFMSGNFISEQLGFQKPTKEFFHACFKVLGDVPKENVLIIGDSLTADIKGGRDYGIQTCWYNHNHVERGQAVEADYIIESLAELKNIL